MSDFGASFFASLGEYFGGTAATGAAAAAPATGAVGSTASAGALGITPGLTLTPAAVAAGTTTAGGAIIPAGFTPIAAGVGAGITTGNLLRDAATGLQVAGTIAQTRAATGQADAQAAQQEFIAQQQELQTEYDYRANQQHTRQVEGQNNAIAGASGVNPFAGSPLEMALSNAYEGGLTSGLIKYGGGLRAAQSRLGAAYSKSRTSGLVTAGALSTMGDLYRGYKGYA